MIQTNKPILFFDLETTGVDIAKDRIVQFAALLIEPNGVETEFTILINPEMPIPKEASDIHGVTDEMVANMPTFKEASASILILFHDAVICGYNHVNFDMPILAEELLRCGLELPAGLPMIDAGNLFKKKEERTLSAAVRFYCGREIEGAHNALNDVRATRDVLFAQLERYTDVPRTEKELEEFTRFGEPRVDFAGKFAIDQDGDYIYAFGKNKGQKIKNDTGFLRWMFGKDFTRDTLKHAERILEEVSQPWDPFS